MENIEGTIYASMFAMFYVANDDMVWCFPGEKMMIFGFIDGCNFFGTTY